MSKYRFLNALFLSAAVLAAPGVSGGAAAQDNDGAYYFFGDSDLEQGNYQLLAGLTPDDGYPFYCGDGLCRNTNGLAWVEQLGRRITPFEAAEPGNEGLNFAVAGAHMTAMGDESLGAPTGVAVQVQQFSDLVASGALQVSRDDVFFVHAGPNDLTRVLLGEPAELVIGDLVSAAAGNIEILANAGARTIVISEVQPVQYLPPFSSPELASLSAAAAELVAAANSGLTSAVTTLGDTLPEDVNIITMKHTAFLEYLRNNATELGFQSISQPCVDPFSGALCSQDLEEQNQHIFFDSGHYSAASHTLLAAWYQATLNAASGEASREAGRLIEATLFEGERERDALAIARRTGLSHEGHGVRFFAAPLGANAYMRGVEGAPNLDLEWRGGLMGIEASFGDKAFAGVAGAWRRSEGSFESGGAYEGWTGSAHAFAGAQIGPIELTGDFTYARPEFTEINRATGVPLLTATGETRGRYFAGGVTARASHRFELAELSASLSLSYADLHINGFDETGADGLSLRFNSLSDNNLMLKDVYEVRLHNISHHNGFSIRPVAQLTHRIDLADGLYEVSSRLIDNTAKEASITANSFTGSELDVGGGFEATIAKRVALGVSYNRTVAGANRSTDALQITLGGRF